MICPNSTQGSASLFFILAFAFLASSTEATGIFSRLLNLMESNEKTQQPFGTTFLSFDDHGILLARLSNNNSIPLVGVGVGNSPRAYVDALVAEAIQDDKKTRLIDTSHKSKNEELVAQGILHGIARMKNLKKIQIHVVTKVWYTHLGYERTKIAVRDSIATFRSVIDSVNVDLHMHVLLHWPRCDHSVPWMECDQEEANLPIDVRNAGPNPVSDPDNAWKESWKLLEDMYLSNQYPIASIGVSNFNKQDLVVMHTFARVHPHIVQVSLWSLLYDAELVDYCHQQKIHLQSFNVMHGTVMQPEISPRAFHHIQKVAIEISDEIQDEVTPAQVILAWLIQHGVSVVPRTSKLARLRENSARELSHLPVMTDQQVETVAYAVQAYLENDDLENDIHVSVSFHAVSKDLMIYWVNEDDEEIRLAYVKQGERFDETTYPNHVYRTYDASNRDLPYHEHRVQANFGQEEMIRI